MMAGWVKLFLLMWKMKEDKGVWVVGWKYNLMKMRDVRSVHVLTAILAILRDSFDDVVSGLIQPHDTVR